MTLPSIERFERLGDAELATFRDTLARHAFLEETVDAIDRIAPLAPGEVRMPIVHEELARRPEPGFRLALLLEAGGRLARAEVDRLLGPALTTALLDAGVLTAEADGVASPFRIQPGPRTYFLADRGLDDLDSVMPPGPSTRMLADLLPERCDGAVLDVGCGPGSLALIAAARGARRVLGTDINARAIAMARFNARWNGLDAEFRTGDLLGPAEGERFDLVVSQPPFIAQPPGVTEVTFLHGGARGDRLFLRLMNGLGAVLAPGGEAIVLCDVPMRGGDEMRRYLEEEVKAPGVDVLALHLAGHDPDFHALVYARHGAAENGPEYIREVQQHRHHLQSLGVERFRHTLFLARPAGDAPAASHELAVRDLRGAVPSIRERIRACVRAARLPDAALLASRIRVAPDAQWMSLRRAPEGEQIEHRVRFGDGWPALEQIVTDEGLALASLLEQCGSVAEAIAGYAEMCDSTAAEVRAPLLDYIRRSLLTGMLAPAAEAAADSEREPAAAGSAHGD